MASYNCQPLYETYSVYVSPSAYVFEPSSSGLASDSGRLGINEKEVRESLHVDRRTGQLSLNVSSQIPLGRDKVITCYGILGMITLSTTEYIVIITQRTPSCRLLSQPIFLATDFRLLPLSSSSTSKAILGNPVEKELVSLVEQGLRAGSLWFSYGWDLTNTLQRQKALEDAGRGEGRAPLWQRADDAFFWNRFLQTRLIEATEGGTDLSRFILPAMFGSLELRSSTINGRDFLFCLISRRARFRVGTRYFSRGIDPNGHVSNFNETEQIVLLDPIQDNNNSMRGRIDGRERLSFVQIRGSVPVYWAEINTLRYKPDLQIMDIPETEEAYRTHMNTLVKHYGSVYAVNLVNQKGYEQPVKAAFEQQVERSKNDPSLTGKVHYLYWDFHAECKGMRFDRIDILINDLAEPLNQMGWFHSVADAPASFNSSAVPSKVISEQTGVIRCNCMDCLDRTNVAQSAFGKWALNNQLRQAGILSHKESIDSHADFMSIFRNVWADHADSVSKPYAGAGALKTDFTRTGVRTKQGLLADGYNSVVRYIKNNYFDGDRQDAYDLVTGGWVSRRGTIPPLSDTRPLIIRSMPYVLVFALTMIFAALTLPRSSEWSIYSFLLLWFLLAFVSLTFIWGNGISYVSWPRLNPPVEVLTYQGPGFKSTQHGRGMSINSLVPVNRKRAKRTDDIELKKKGSLID